ncbi:MAG: hypothetical protein RBR53_05810 [Desulforegulaceae bacterium]|nr:hypothetical protein [Desulforegulaceae bacterium]
MIIEKKDNLIMDKIHLYKKKMNEIDTKITLYLSDKKKYPHPGQESFVEEVRKFENSVHSYPNKEVQYFLDNLMESLRIHEKIWRQKFLNFENKRKKIFSDQEIKDIYNFYTAKNNKKNIDFNHFKERFSKAIKIQSEKLKSNETLKIKYLDTGEIRIKKEKIEHF